MKTSANVAHRRGGFESGRGRGLLSAFSLLTLALAISVAGLRADPPAEDHVFVDAAGLNRFAWAFGAERAEAFKKELAAAGGEASVPVAGLDTNRYAYAGSSGAAYGALRALIGEALKKGDAKLVSGFLGRVNGQKMICGRLVAKEGGDYDVSLSLEGAGTDSALVVTQTFREGGRTASHRYSMDPAAPVAPVATTAEPAPTPPSAGGKRKVETETHDNGKKKSEMSMLYDAEEDDWIMDGPYVEWDENGQKRVEGAYRKGLQDGVWTMWDEKGIKREENAYRMGERDGAWSEWDDKGRLTDRTVFKDGKRVEEQEISWNDNGTKWREEITRYGTDGKKSEEVAEWDYHSNGKPKVEKRELDGRRHGTWTKWDENGAVADSVEYRRGVAIPPEDPQADEQGKLARQVFLKAADLDTFDKAALEPLAAKLDEAGRKALVSVVFKSLQKSDDNHPEIFERLYFVVMEFAPATDAAQQSYWRLSNMYRMAYNEPQHEKIVTILEQFLQRYKESRVVSMEKYPDEMLVFSPVRVLHQAYEALNRFEPIVAWYDGRAKRNLPMKAYDCFDYAQALEKVNRGKDAIPWYEKFLELDKGASDFMAGIAKERIEELKKP